MNKLEQQLIKILESALSVAEKTGSFVIEQAPQLLKEFYIWNTSKYILGIILSIFILLSARFLSNIWSEKYNGGQYDYNKIVMFGRLGEGGNMIVPFIVLSVIGLPIFIINVYYLIFITVAPKMYLIEHFSVLLK